MKGHSLLLLQEIVQNTRVDVIATGTMKPMSNFPSLNCHRLKRRSHKFSLYAPSLK
jgi:hypothetical protein